MPALFDKYKNLNLRIKSMLAMPCHMCQRRDYLLPESQQDKNEGDFQGFIENWETIEIHL